MHPISIKDTRRSVNQSLKKFFKEQSAEANRLDVSYERLWKVMEKACLAGGKRLRPYLCLLAYQAFGGKRITDVMDLAMAQELLHMSLLIHDDIIDRDYVRHGVENVAGQYRKLYEKLGLEQSDLDHYAASVALLAGDLLLSSAQTLLSEGELDSTTRLAISNQFQRSIFAVGGGQLMDTESAFTDWQHVDPLKTACYKTAEYSFVGPLVSGALVAKASSDAIKSLEHFGRNLGIAFQITDDILGSFGNPAATGKSVNNDIREGKKTYLFVATYRKAGQEQRKFIEKALSSNNMSDAQVVKIKTIMQSSGALAEAEKSADNYKTKALKELKNLNLELNYLKAFKTFADNVTRRSE